MPSKDDLTKFLDLYKANFSLKSNRVALLFLNNFNKYLSALEYLSTLKEKDKEDQFVETSNQIFSLSGYWQDQEKWKSITPISSFKIKIDWVNNDPNTIDPEIYMYQNIFTLIDKIAEEVNKLKITDTPRKLFAILLQTLLPFYFVKAANITNIVNYLRQKLPNFVCVGYEPKDYPPMKEATELSDSWEYSACRGFLADSDDHNTIHFLLLGFNLLDDSVPHQARNMVQKKRDEFIKKLLALAAEKKDRSQQQSFSPTASTVFPNYQLGLNYALSSEPILLNGMKVIFDQSASVYPVSLQPKTISAQSEKIHFGFAKGKSKKQAPKQAPKQDIGGAPLSWTPKTEVDLMRFATKEEVDQLIKNNYKYGFVVKHKNSTRNAVWFVDQSTFKTESSYTVDFASDRPYILKTKLKVTDQNFINFEHVDPKDNTRFKGEAEHPDQVIVKDNEEGAYGIGRNLIDKNEITVEDNPKVKQQKKKRK